MKKLSCVVIISLFCLSSILPAVNSYYIENGLNDLKNSFASGLMDSAWPMQSHDNKHTGRSSFGVLGKSCVVKWKFNLSGLSSSPVIDKNGILYIGGKTDLGANTLFAINPDSSLKWSFYTGGSVYSTPAIGSDGTIYFGSHTPSGCLYAILSDGTEKWRFNMGGNTEYITSSPAIANDGTIYFGASNGNIYALNHDGSEKWHYTTEARVLSSPAIDDNGNVYVGSEDKYVYALKPNGTLIWKYKTGGWVESSPVISDDGIIYFGSRDTYLYALYPNGTLKWKFITNHWVDHSPALDLDGNIYVGSILGCFYSISPNGVENWRVKIDNGSVSSPVIDKFGVIYVGLDYGKLYVLNPDGSIRWIWSFVPGYRKYIGNLAIGEEGTIYFCLDFLSYNFYSYLYAIKVVENNKPNKPTIEGPLNGYIENEYFYVADSIDKDNDNISYLFDWGNGKNSGWTSFISSGTNVNISHVWNERGFYNVKVKSKDIWGDESEWSESLIVFIEMEQPDKPIIKGASNGRIKENQIYKIVTIDYQGDDVEFYVDWGDEINTSWIGPYPSGENVTISHTWKNKDIYTIKAKARDIYGHESDWATLEVTMPKSYINNPIIQLLMMMLGRFSFFEKILKQ